MFGKLAALWRRYWISIRVIATFLFLITAFFIILTWKPIIQYVDLGAGLAQLAAWMSYGILWVLGKVVGFDVHIMGTIMSSGNFEVDIAPACSGAVPTSIYLAAVFAYPAGWKPKLIGAAIGIGVIHLVNLLRVSAAFPDRPLLPSDLSRDSRLRGAGSRRLRRRSPLALLGHAFRRCACKLIRGAFLARLIVLFFLTYLVWAPSARYYKNVLLWTSRAAIWVTELPWGGGTTLRTGNPCIGPTFAGSSRGCGQYCSTSSECPKGVECVRGICERICSETSECQGPCGAAAVCRILPDTAIFYHHTGFERLGISPQGIPAEWVMANLVLLLPLMLATPAPNWRVRLKRLAIAFVAALCLQVVDVMLAVKSFSAEALNWGPLTTRVYKALRRLLSELGHADVSVRDLGGRSLSRAGGNATRNDGAGEGKRSASARTGTPRAAPPQAAVTPPPTADEPPAPPRVDDLRLDGSTFGAVPWDPSEPRPTPRGSCLG